jgi:hypothetical protein
MKCARTNQVTRFFVRAILSFPLLLSVCAAQEPPGARQQFADVAQKLRAFPPDWEFAGTGNSGFLGGPPMDLARPHGFAWPGTPGTAEYQALMQKDYPVPFLLSLLKDPDAKIRTLAAAALVAKGDPRLQRYLAPLVDDQSLTFDVLTFPLTDNYVPPQYAPQTVAMAVLQLTQKVNREAFDQYWATHDNRDYCADWFLWQFHRPQFAPVARHAIQDVPSPDRELIILWIGSGRSDFANERYVGYSEAELLDAAKHLGRQDLLAVLRKQPPTTDPDILHPKWPTSSFEHYSEMGHFLLAHAKDLLAPSDCEALLALEIAERKTRSWAPVTNADYDQGPAYREWWPIAAASLRPDEADAILDVAQTRWPDTGNISLARWDIRGPSALPKILQWFDSSPAAKESLAKAIYLAKPNEQYEPIVAAILASKERLLSAGLPMFTFAELKAQWKAHDLDRGFVDWVYAQPYESVRTCCGRSGVVRIARVGRQLALDPRFSTADASLLVDIEQSAPMKLSHSESLRLDQLLRDIKFGERSDAPASTLGEIRTLVLKGAHSATD